MRRRTFIITVVAASSAITLPIICYRVRNNLPKNPLARPEVLAELTDEKTIREIGISYRKQLSSENSKERLRELLITDQHGRQTAPTDDPALSKWLEDKIRSDFSTFTTTTVNGWIISVTEARQCALLSLL